MPLAVVQPSVQPLASAAAAPAAVPAASSAHQLLRETRAGRRILLVEDHRINQEVAKALLRRAGLVVEGL